MPSIIRLDEPRMTPRYKHRGRYLWSVTQILDITGFISFEGIDPEILKNKASIGTEVHHYAALKVQDKPRLLKQHYEKMSKRAKDYATSVDMFLEDYLPIYDVVISEKSLYIMDNAELGISEFAGTPDLVLSSKRSPTHKILFDYKTRELKFYDALQGIGYSQLIESNYGFYIDELRVVELRGLGGYKIHKIRLTNRHRNIFNSAATVVLARHHYNVI